VFQVCEVFGAEVWHRMRLQVAPDALDRVEFRRVSGQILEGDRTFALFYEGAHEFGAVCLQSIPDDQQLPAYGLGESLEKLNDLRTADRAGVQPKVKAQKAHSCDRRKLLPAEAILKDGSLTPWSPGSCATGSFG
jgi:hypothetical protein